MLPVAGLGNSQGENIEFVSTLLSRKIFSFLGQICLLISGVGKLWFVFVWVMS